MKGFALWFGKAVAVLAALSALASRFTSCIIIVYQPKMPEKVRSLNGISSIINHA